MDIEQAVNSELMEDQWHYKLTGNSTEQSPAWETNISSDVCGVDLWDWLPSSQAPVTGVNCEPIESSSHSQTYFYKIHFNIILPLHRGLPSGIFTLYSSITILHVLVAFPMRAKCPTRLPTFYVKIINVFSLSCECIW
jgi:hypothetical protein